MKTSVVKNYVFDKVAQTLTFSDYSTISLNKIISITDVTNGQMLYYYKNPSYGGTVLNNVFTFAVDVTGSKFNNTDKFNIEYVDSDYSRTVLASAAFIASGTVDVDHDAKGVILFINVSAVTGTTPSMTVKLQVYDTASATWVDITGAATAAITTTGMRVLTIAPGVVEAANSKLAYPIPQTFRIAYAITGTSPSFTMTIGAKFLK